MVAIIIIIIAVIVLDYLWGKSQENEKKPTKSKENKMDSEVYWNALFEIFHNLF